MKFELLPLPYSYNALEPHIDEETMRVHHDKHHQAYINKLNEALKKYSDLADKSLEFLLKNLDLIPDDIKKAVRNNGGGHYNHSFFWQIMKPDIETSPAVGLQLIFEIEKTLGNFDNFKKQFSDVAANFFGSGWCWLVLNNDGKLEIITLPNHDCPITAGQIPLLVLDLWEHAYYLKYQNRRAEYISAWWNVINWEEANNNFIRGKLPTDKVSKTE